MRVPADQPFVPVILGGDIGAYSLAREFHEAYGAVSVVVPSVMTGIVSHSRILDARPFPDQDDAAAFLAFVVGLGRELAGAGDDGGVRRPLLLMGSADPHVRFMVEHRDALAEFFTVPYASTEQLDAATYKDSFYALCERVGVDHPATVDLDLRAELDDGAAAGLLRRVEEAGIPYPAIAKAADSVAWGNASFPGKKKVHTVAGPDELERLVVDAHAGGYRGGLVVQDLIPGGDHGMRLVTFFGGRDGEPRFASAGRVLVEEHAPGALGNSAAIVAEPDPDMVEAGERLVRELRWPGFCMFDAKLDPRDGRLRFFELNPRLGRNHYYVTAAGHNVARLYVREYLPGVAAALGEAPAADGFEVSKGTHLYSVLPRPLLMRYVPERLRAAIAALYKADSVTHPFVYKAETNPRRWAYIVLSQVNQFRKFRRFHPGVREWEGTRVG